MDFFVVYTITTLLPNMSVFLGIIAIISGLLSVVACIMYIACDKDDRDFHKIQKFKSTVLPIFIISLPIAILCPSQNQMYKLIGAYYATNIEDIENLPPNTVKALNKFLEDYVEE